MLALADLDVTRQWRAVTVGALFEDAAVHPSVHTGRDLKPYGPWAVKAAEDAGDVIITWRRRTRIGGELKDGTGTVPLAEASEAYEVDILAAPGGAVLRTLDSWTAHRRARPMPPPTSPPTSVPCRRRCRWPSISSARSPGAVSPAPLP